MVDAVLTTGQPPYRTRIVTEGRHGEGLTKATAENDAKWWDTWQGQSLDGMIVAKSKTPFAPLWTDRYPTEKAESP